MKTYLYLTLAPEALVASHLSPVEFGNYLAVGTFHHSSGQALFFEIDPSWRTDALPMHDLEQRCIPHPDGAPRKSRYLAIYRVLEHVPLSTFGPLHLATHDGHVLSLTASDGPPPMSTERFHLYQEFCPVNPRVVSIHNPISFSAQLTDMSEAVSVPKIVFAELKLGALANNPDTRDTGNLPYRGIDHLRDCLRELIAKPHKPTKVLVRNVTDDVLFRTIKDGYFVGEKRALKYYPMRALTELESIHHAWWKAAQNAFGG